MLLYTNDNFYTIKIEITESDLKLSKIKEKKLNSIKSEMEEIKEFVITKNNLNISEDIETDFLDQNNNDTLTLTKIVEQEAKVSDNNDLEEIKKELKELKSMVTNNKNLLKEILIKIR